MDASHTAARDEREQRLNHARQQLRRRAERQFLFTDVNESDDNVLVFTRLDLDELQAAFMDATEPVTWADAYEVPERDRQYYLYEPLHVGEECEAKILAKLAKRPGVAGR